MIEINLIITWNLYQCDQDNKCEQKLKCLLLGIFVTKCYLYKSVLNLLVAVANRSVAK